jgi:ParB family transcriptional regulator, chromosome partitioning protein
VSNNTTSRLGKGLEALIPSISMTTQTKDSTDGSYKSIPIKSISPNPFQPRLHFDPESISHLADSIRQHGLTQPIVVRVINNGYELVAGERRFRACGLAGLDEVPAIIKSINDKDSLQLALIENLEREDLNPIEIAKGYQRLIIEFDVTHETVGTLFGKSRASVSNTLRLLKLPEAIQGKVSSGAISEGHARTLLSLDSDTKIDSVVEQVISQKMSVRDTETLVTNTLPKKKESKSNSDKYQPNRWYEIQAILSDKLKSKVSVKGARGKGKIEIQFNSSDDIERLFNLLQ